MVNLTAGPDRVMNVNYETMLVLDGSVLVRMVMRLRSLPSLVLMVMMLADLV